MDFEYKRKSPFIFLVAVQCQSMRNLDITGNFPFLFNVAVQLSVDAEF